MSEAFADQGVPPSPQLELSLQRAEREAVQHGHPTVRVEHLLLALLDDGEAALLFADVDRIHLTDALLARLFRAALQGASWGLPTRDRELTALLVAAADAAATAGLAAVDGPLVLATLLLDGGPAADVLVAHGLQARAPTSAAVPAEPRGSGVPGFDLEAALAEPELLGPGGTDPFAAPLDRGPRLERPPSDPHGDDATWPPGPEPVPPLGSDVTESDDTGWPSPPADAAKSDDDGWPAPADAAESDDGGWPSVPEEPAPAPEPGLPPGDDADAEDTGWHLAPEEATPAPADAAKSDDTRWPSVPEEPAPAPDEAEAEAEDTGWPAAPEAPSAPGLDDAEAEATGRHLAKEAPMVEYAPTATYTPTPAPALRDALASAPAPAPAPASRAPASGRRARALRASSSEPHSGVREGQLAHDIPDRMRVAVPVRVEARLAAGERGELTLGMHGVARIEQVLVTKAMSVRLVAPDGGFVIETTAPETQWVEGAPEPSLQPEYGRWLWTVTPRKRGTRRLQLVLSARTVDPSGVTADTNLPEQVIAVRVNANMGRSARQVSAWAATALLGGALGAWGQDIVRILQDWLGR